MTICKFSKSFFPHQRSKSTLIVVKEHLGDDKSMAEFIANAKNTTRRQWEDVSKSNEAIALRKIDNLCPEGCQEGQYLDIHTGIL
jgi:hypothetical protein